MLAIGVALTTGLGLGAASAIFATSEAAWTRAVPFHQARRLVHLWELGPSLRDRTPTSYPVFRAWKTDATEFSDVEAYDPSNLTVGLGAQARMLRGAAITTGFFGMLRVRVSQGRDFMAHDDDGSGTAVAIVSARLAHELGDAAVGRTIRVNGSPSVIVGTLPSTFSLSLLQDADVFVPLSVGARQRMDWSDRFLRVIARLRDGASLSRAQAQATTIVAAHEREAPELSGREVVAESLRDAVLGRVTPIMASLLGAVALLLAIMTANLALLMIAQYAHRRPELVMRSTLGASRARVLRQLFVESLLPALVGSALAMALGQGATRVLVASIPPRVAIDMPYLADAGLDGRLVTILAGITIALTVAFGVAPALFATAREPRLPARRTTASRADRRLRRVLVSGQLALTVVLLVASGLLVMSFRNLIGRDVGFRDPDRIVTARAPLSGPRYETADAQQRFYETMLDRARALPGVRDAGMVDEIPGGGGGTTTFVPVDAPTPPSRRTAIVERTVAGEYFETMGIPLLHGRVFGRGDQSGAPRVAVISASFAKLLDATGGALGRMIRLGAAGDSAWEVVGIVGDVQVTSLDTDAPPTVYLSHRQRPENRMTLVLRTSLPAASVGNQVREIVRRLDPNVPVYAVSAIGDQLDASIAVFNRRLPMMLCTVFGAAALALSLVALYAICAHDVTTRRRELGIRIALGSDSRAIRRLILRDAARVADGGIGVGLIVATLATRGMRAVLFGVAPNDWSLYGLIAVGVGALATAACLIPAERAASTDPASVLQAE